MFPSGEFELGWMNDWMIWVPKIAEVLSRQIINQSINVRLLSYVSVIYLWAHENPAATW